MTFESWHQRPGARLRLLNRLTDYCGPKPENCNDAQIRYAIADAEHAGSIPPLTDEERNVLLADFKAVYHKHEEV